MKKLLICLSLSAALLFSYSCGKPDGPNPPSPNPPSGPTDPSTPTDPPSPPDPPTPPTPTEPYFSADIKDVYPFNCGSNGVEVKYQTNISGWTVTPDADWCTVSVNESAFVILVSEYDPRYDNGAYKYTDPRTCSVTLTAGTAFSKTFKVLQESKTAITLPYEPVLLSASGATAEILVRNNCYDWTIACDASWLTCTKKDGMTLTVTSTARPVDEKTPRKAQVTLTSALDITVKSTITVADADASLSGEDFNYGDHIDWD